MKVLDKASLYLLGNYINLVGSLIYLHLVDFIWLVLHCPELGWNL